MASTSTGRRKDRGPSSVSASKAIPRGGTVRELQPDPGDAVPREDLLDLVENYTTKIPAKKTASHAHDASSWGLGSTVHPAASIASSTSWP